MKKIFVDFYCSWNWLEENEKKIQHSFEHPKKKRKMVTSGWIEMSLKKSSDYIFYMEGADDDPFEEDTSSTSSQAAPVTKPKSDYVKMTWIDFLFFKSLTSYLFKKGKGFEEIMTEFEKEYKTIKPEERTLRYWIAALTRGEQIVSVSKAPGRQPISGIGTILHEHIRDNPHISLVRLCQLVNLANRTVKRIIKDELEYKQVSVRWVPHILTEDNIIQRYEKSMALLHLLEAQVEMGFENVITGDETWLFLQNPLESVWIPAEKDRPVAQRSSHYATKVMLTVFFCGKDVVFQKALPKGKTMDGPTFIAEILSPLQETMKKRGYSKKNPVYLHMDNAPCHTSKIVKSFLEQSIFVLLPHPPYSPDISPCDFFLFGYLKFLLRGKTFKTIEELLEEATRILNSISSSMLLSTFHNWLKRCKQVRRNPDEYL